MFVAKLNNPAKMAAGGGWAAIISKKQ